VAPRSSIVITTSVNEYTQEQKLTPNDMITHVFLPVEISSIENQDQSNLLCEEIIIKSRMPFSQ
jgi:hypothetical protein